MANNPQTLEQTGGSLSPYPWFAVHSKPLQEKRAAESLSAWGIETFLPGILTPSRKFQALFSSYLFASCPREVLHKFQFTQGVSYVVSFGGEPAEVPAAVIEEIKAGMTGGYCRPDSLRIGDQVVITSGSFAELRGIFHREISGTERVVILLDALQRATIQLSRRDLRHA